MKLILITGLDGSGKSSLLDKLELETKGKNVAFLRVPKIDAETFKSNNILYKTALFINKLHADADQLKSPQLKVIALFSAMLIFKNLSAHLEKSNFKLIFCERHPLIDTSVYLKFYAAKINPKELPIEFADKFDNNFSEEINYLMSLLQINKTIQPSLHTLLQFIHNHFLIEKNHELENLNELFKIKLPEKIIYLSAEPETLMLRLSNRILLEAHESLETFKKLIPVYESVLKKSGVETIIINANSFDNLDRVFDDLKNEYFP